MVHSFGFLDYFIFLTVNLVMDKIANRPRGFAFIRYVTEEESQKAIEGMHGKVHIKISISKLNFMYTVKLLVIFLLDISWCSVLRTNFFLMA